MENHSSATKELLLISFLTVFAIGVGVGIGLSLNMENSNSEDLLFELPKTSPGFGDVPVDKECVVDDLLVEQGSITPIYDNIPAELPICLDPAWAADKFMLVSVIGGYTPIDGTMITVSDKDGKVWNDCIPGMWVGWSVEWEDVTNCGNLPVELGEYPLQCCEKIWKLTLNTDCNNWVCLDSSYYPIIEGCCTLGDFDGAGNLISENNGLIPGKEITIEFNTKWQGCTDEEQQFYIILAHKNQD